MNHISFEGEGRVIITSPHGEGIILSPDEVRKIVDEYELLNAIEDVKSKLSERYEGDENELGYDTEKYTTDIVRDMAKEVIKRKGNSENIYDTYWFIVDWVIDDSKDVDEDYRYEIYGAGTAAETVWQAPPATQSTGCKMCCHCSNCIAPDTYEKDGITFCHNFKRRQLTNFDVWKKTLTPEHFTDDKSLTMFCGFCPANGKTCFKRDTTCYGNFRIWANQTIKNEDDPF